MKVWARIFAGLLGFGAAHMKRTCISFFVFTLLSLPAWTGCGGTNGSGPVGGGGTGCETGEEGCACFGNDTCNDDLSCLSDVCVDTGSGSGSASSSGGSDGSGGSAGDGSGGDGSGGDGSGGDGSGGDGSGGDGSGGDGSGGDGSGGSSSTGGSNSTGGNDGSGGGPSADTCGGAAANIVDNFHSCDENICEIAGRKGVWYGEADLLVNDDFEVDEPGGTWGDNSCAAIATGGSAEVTNVDFAYIGVILNGGAGYDVSGYSGVRIDIESDDQVYVSIVTSDGGHYGVNVPGGTGGTSQIRNAAFGAMVAAGDNVGTKDLTNVEEIHFAADDPTGYGFAIHGVEFY